MSESLLMENSNATWKKKGKAVLDVRVQQSGNTLEKKEK